MNPETVLTFFSAAMAAFGFTLASVFLATYFETNGHFDSNIKLFSVTYAYYRPMTDAKRKSCM
jgi:hypothetical protein